MGGGPSGGTVSENRTLWLVVSYLGPLALAPFLLEQDDREVQWHAKNGLLLFGVNLVFCFISFAILSVPFLNCLGCLPIGVLGVAMLALHIVCIVKALNGERFRIPGLSEYADRDWG